ncbi:hypothetical protein E2P71_05655 [Candidatus Bathyarchaeota archaeon]|nr:hypothetical protein E2P71_05655 [Candidatus Bathyarchaeota archaeon]
MNDSGVLHSDTYVLYPYEEKSINIGFSKYGELIDADAGVGLEYDGVDVFANPAVPMWKWSNGWVMEVHYTEQNKLRSVWAYALFSDNSDVSGIGGNWKQMQQSKDASAVGDQHGGRRTSGWAETDDIRLVYDGPRKAIYLLKTTIYDKDPLQTGKPLVEITTQLVFNKVKKYIMEIKDVKRVDDNKFDGPFQIEFSQRGEWDIGTESNNEAWAEFYDGFETKYDKHPFYYPCVETDPVTFDVAQMIDQDEGLVGFAAFWPTLISKWVTNVDSLDHLGGDDIPGKLETMETEEKYISVPTALPPNVLWPNYLWIDGANNLVIDLQDELVCYPRGACEWSDEPWVFKRNAQGEYVKLVPDLHWTWNDYVLIDPDYWVPGDQFCVVYKRFMKGHEEHTIIPAECNELEASETSYGMLAEPKVPYVFAEWDFDLDYDHPENSTQQFRCVSVYGLTDYNNALDPDMPGYEGYYRIDKEVTYQLNEVFNPWDLKDAANKDTFRWAQKGTYTEDDIALQAHLHDKYGNDRTCLEENHTLVNYPKWGYYCNDDEKVILYDSTGAEPALLLERDVDYTITPFTVHFLKPFSDYDLYKVLYSTYLLDSEESPWHVGRWEWIVVGEPSLASDSIGTGMVASAWSDWKNVETWLSGLDVQSEVFGPTMPYTMRRFATGLDGGQDFQYDFVGGDYRSAFKDDWSTPDEWSGEEIYPYAISSSNIIVVGGPLVDLAAYYFNDFTDAFVFSEYGDGFYAPGCWARTTQDHWQDMDIVDATDDQLWYDSTTVDDDVGYAIISTYKDLNETVGFIVYGYTAEDTYYACYALRGGGLPWLQLVQEGVTTVLLEIDYSDLHPVSFHVREFLGPFTECTGAYTNFKTPCYYDNIECGTAEIEEEAAELGLCYKLVDIGFCGQVHPDP